MKPEYEAWIVAKLLLASPIGECFKWTSDMLLAFPELKQVRGHVLLSNGLEREHWWLETETGAQVDPTRAQFMDYLGADVVCYEPWPEGQPEPTGMCPNCGGHCYDHRGVCSDACGRSYAAYLNNPRAL